MQTQINLSELDDSTLLVVDELIDRPAKLNDQKEIVKPATKGILRISRSTWYAGVASGRFPQPVKLGPQKRAWRAGDIKKLIENQQL